MRFAGLVECTGSEVLPRLSKFELHKLFQYHVKDQSQASEGARFPLQVLPSFSEKGSEKEMQAFLIQISEMVLKELGIL